MFAMVGLTFHYIKEPYEQSIGDYIQNMLLLLIAGYIKCNGKAILSLSKKEKN